MLDGVERGPGAVAETSKLSEARAALAVVSARTSRLVASLPDTSVPIPGSRWTVREAAVHLTVIGFHLAGMAQGEPNQHPCLAPEECARRNDEFNADIPESDPGALAALVREGTDCLLAATASRGDNEEVGPHSGGVVSMPHLVAAALAEHLLHGYDIAVAAHRPWPIDP
ncbi:MAG TPA: maleylpyruvate isomerase N-terminal domain-containing protein, partial [Pseudonocardia sp.]